jgi:RNA-directed DNA polymerase
MRGRLRDIFFDKIRYQSATGVDKVRPESFEKNIDSEIDFIVRKVENDDFKFHPYKELLISKGRGKIPRVISVPSVRDKLLLSYMNSELADCLKVETHDVYFAVKKIVESLKKRFHYFAKLDIVGFYDNIDHDLLLGKMKDCCPSRIHSLVELAIKNETIELNKKKTGIRNIKGVPQGIPISNLIANYFLKDLDDHFKKEEDVFYLRYVDDIILLAKTKDALLSSLEVAKGKIEENKLELNVEKEIVGHVEEGFDFLGYNFKEFKEDINISVRRTSSQKMYLSVLQTINTFKFMKEKGRSPRLEKLLWDLNIKITGAIIDNKRYGWLFFFSQMDEDDELLYKLDAFVLKELKKRGLTSVQPKKFVRAHKEIRKNGQNTGYIPNFDNYSFDQISKFLRETMRLSDEQLLLMSPTDKKVAFRKYIFSTVKKLEKDLITTS